MLKERDRDILEHIIKYCDRIKDAIARFGETLETLKADAAYQDAVSMCVLQIGELTTHLTTEFKKANAQIPWKEIVGMRNIAAHHYEKFKIKRLYKTITIEVPELREYCQELIDEAGDTQDITV